jgi:hypothetical protein
VNRFLVTFLLKKRQVYILVEVEQKTQISVVDTVQYRTVFRTRIYLNPNPDPDIFLNPDPDPGFANPNPIWFFKQKFEKIYLHQFWLTTKPLQRISKLQEKLKPSRNSTTLNFLSGSRFKIWIH